MNIEAVHQFFNTLYDLVVGTTLTLTVAFGLWAAVALCLRWRKPEGR